MTTVTVDHLDDGIARITLNRPRVLNALDRELIEELHAAIRGAEADSSVRAVILTGAGRAFSAGFDLKAEAAEGPQPTEVWVDRFLDDWNVFMDIWRSAKPYIAAVRGYNLGGSLELSLLCDVTLATPDAKFGLPEIRHAGGPGPSMLTWCCGMKAAKWLMLSGESIDASRALEIGIVTEIVPEGRLESVAADRAASLAAIPPIAMKLTKMAVNRIYERMGFVGAVNESYLMSTVMNSTVAYRDEEKSRVGMPLKDYIKKRDTKV